MQVPIAEGLFTWPSHRPQLIGGKCSNCRVIVFPRPAGCPRCTGPDVVDQLLADRGTLWSWTVQGFPPPSPPYRGEVEFGSFVPFGVGYVELPGETRVETRLTVNDPAHLEIGMEMQLALIPLYLDASGREVITYAFEPVPVE